VNQESVFVDQAMFEVRGIALVDQRVSDNTCALQLKFASSQPAQPVGYSAASISTLKFGSVFYVWVTPSATGSRIDMLVSRPSTAANRAARKPQSFPVTA
jgi:hypothetical protein